MFERRHGQEAGRLGEGRLRPDRGPDQEDQRREHRADPGRQRRQAGGRQGRRLGRLPADLRRLQGAGRHLQPGGRRTRRRRRPVPAEGRHLPHHLVHAVRGPEEAGRRAGHHRPEQVRRRAAGRLRLLQADQRGRRTGAQHPADGRPGQGPGQAAGLPERVRHHRALRPLTAGPQTRKPSDRKTPDQRAADRSRPARSAGCRRVRDNGRCEDASPPPARQRARPA
ncbi:putative RNA-binding protein Jag [Actinacidiphila bryophytorum]|uniref:RNA-binding protein Jag n=1 Tax=Actinacidiphila bryophytorum TaxID=1436133 RepID=A0A9W4H3Z8_9ACTN|nr:putative RNA-binding protein Jag [Actinacidiphila bryophytorum]